MLRAKCLNELKVSHLGETDIQVFDINALILHIACKPEVYLISGIYLYISAGIKAGRVIFQLESMPEKDMVNFRIIDK